MPMLHVGGNLHDIPWFQGAGRFAPRLVPALTIHADKNLTTTGFCMVNVPIIAASWFESDVENGDGVPIMRQFIEVGFSGEMLDVGFVEVAKSEKAAVRSGAYLLIADGLAFYHVIPSNHIGVGGNPTVVEC